MNTLVTNTTIVTMDAPFILENSSIGWSNGDIDYIGSDDKSIPSNYDLVIDGKNLIVLPGLINAHFHSTSTLLKGMAQDVPESQWMMKAMAPLSQFLTSEDRILGSKLAVLEGIRTGTTTFAEYSGDIKILWDRVYDPLGARMVAAETINEIVSDKTRQAFDDLYQLEYEQGQAAFNRSMEFRKVSQDHERLEMMFGPQALDMITKERLEEVQQISQEEKIKIHMHVAQGEREHVQIEKQYGKSTIDVLNELGYLNNRLLAAHCHNTTQEELELMAKNRVNMVSCQTSIAMIDGIVPPLYPYHRLGGTVAIGTDQVPGVGHVNLFREMRTGAQFAKIIQRDPTVLPPWQMLKHATVHGSIALGVENKTGTLKVGKSADIITVDKQQLTISPVSTLPIRNLLPNLVYNSSGYEVSDVFIAGNQVLNAGKFNISGVDIPELLERAGERLTDIVMTAENNWREIGSKMVEYTDSGYL